MQYRVKRLLKLFRTRCFKSDSTITQIEHASRAFDSLSDQRVGASGRKRNTFPAPALRLQGFSHREPLVSREEVSRREELPSFPESRGARSSKLQRGYAKNVPHS